MPVTLDDVRRALEPDEPKYAKAAALGPDALPILERLILGEDENLASKAAYLAGLIPSPLAADVVATAAASASDVVRIAAASTAGNLPSPEASRVLLPLTDDPSYGVRKMVLRSAPDVLSAELVSRISAMARSDPERALRTRATEVIQRMRPP